MEDLHSEFIELSQGNRSSRTDIEVSSLFEKKGKHYDGVDDVMSLIVG